MHGLMFLMSGFSTDGEIDSVRLVGPRAPATNRRMPTIERDIAASMLLPTRTGFLRVLVRCLPCQDCRLEVDFVGEMLEAVVSLRDALSVERVRFDDVCARFEITSMNGQDHVGTRDGQNVVVALERVFVRVEFELLATKVVLVEFIALDHRAHRSVDDENAVGERLEKFILYVSR